MFKTSDKLIIAAAIISLIASVYLWFSGDKEAGLFVGIWVPSILSLGAYIKISLMGVRQ